MRGLPLPWPLPLGPPLGFGVASPLLKAHERGLGDIFFSK